MNRTYMVNSTVWECDGYRLKKGDIVGIVDKREEQRIIKISNSYFRTQIWVSEEDLLTHCIPIV